MTSQSRQFHLEHTTPRGDWIWVFGSDLAGRHAKGYAKIAKVNFGAMHGQSSGGIGRSYALPVFDRTGRLPMDGILASVAEFCGHAHANPKMQFFVSRISGDALSQDDEAQIARAFAAAPLNCSLPAVWTAHLDAREPVREAAA